MVIAPKPGHTAAAISACDKDHLLYGTPHLAVREHQSAYSVQALPAAWYECRVSGSYGTNGTHDDKFAVFKFSDPLLASSEVVVQW